MTDTGRTLHCAPLAAGPLQASAGRPGIDPALVWADATDFRDFRRPGEPSPQIIPVVVEWAGPDGLELPCTALLDAGALRGLLQESLHGPLEARPATAHWLHRLELQMPVVPRRPRPVQARAAPAAGSVALRAPDAGSVALPVSEAGVLLGVIDCGCPFAHRMLRDAAGTGTRVLRIWDQDVDAPAFTRVGGQAPARFGYGAEIGRANLNALMAAAASRADPTCIDERRCYEAASYDVLRRRFGHGAAVLGLALQGRSCDGPQRHAPAPTPHDVVFVQIPRDAVQDSGSASLDRWVIDALDYIVACAAPGQRVVINLSDGSSRGSHDGQSLIDRAMSGLLKAYRGAAAPNGRQLEIVIAAGNTHDEQRHAQFDDLSEAGSGCVWMRVPPGSETPVVVNLRLPPGARGLRARITPPGAQPGDWAAVGDAMGWTAHGQAGRREVPLAGLVIAVPALEAAPGLAAMGLIVIAPTRDDVGCDPVAPAGDWCIEVAVQPGHTAPAEPVHLWISRGQQNPTALPRSVQARFIDTDRRYDPQPHLRPLRCDPVGPAAVRSPIRRAGTLNALAVLPPGQGLIVAGAALRRDAKPTLYTAAGPSVARGGRIGPDVAAQVDDSQGLRSVRVSGNSSGEICRASGSSFAAPQVARAQALASAHTDTAITPGQPAEPARLGAGILQVD
jgi:hypothetical protein